ncbi:hypothetical protein [Labrys monachus]|uniref:Glucose dehydrogenase n=1 Tax=Labrys monachus TaxID=217067 RepID=A0ABU0FBP9_9HYPH|nr:hypothetical protein [Labrys monachus]MDQ0391470.1 glucose dehydrogenase [Labrys monachus]
MLPLFHSKPVFSAFLFIVVGITMAGGGAWLLFLDGPSFYLFAGLGILLTGAMLLGSTPAAIWFYGVVLLGMATLAVREAGFNEAELESELLAPAILGLYLFMPLAARHSRRRSESRRAEPAFQMRMALLAPALGIVSAIAVGALSVLNSADVSDEALAGRRIANVRGIDMQKPDMGSSPGASLGAPRSADMFSSLNPRFSWRDERTDYP